MFPIICLWMEIIKSYKTILQKFNITYTQYIAMLVLGQHDKIKFKKLGKKLYLDSEIYKKI
ncbi:MAG: Transcriptional regulator, MarR family [Clostridium butyricum DORA_1]|nr:MAG: Transcriptional regulator, MarR family [Clostridium butyricum DORA_1]